jgi:hypothetical protein
MVIAAQKQWSEAGWSAALTGIHFGDRSWAHVGGVPGTILGLAIVAALFVLRFRAGQSAAGPVLPADPTPTVER